MSYTELAFLVVTTKCFVFIRNSPQLVYRGEKKGKLYPRAWQTHKVTEIPGEDCTEPQGPGCLLCNEMHDYRR